MSSENFWELLAGIGIFLFGMHLLEESIRLLSGTALKRFIRNYTSNRYKAIVTGALSTAVLQSSSAVTLMVLAFAGAGIMQFHNAVGVIFGANVGTTFTSWIVALVGFKISIEALALPFIAVGGLGLIFLGKSGRAMNISKLLVGFGFLFMGLDYMKNAVEEASANFNLEAYADSPIVVFVVIGFALTAIVQSSSAAMAIILSGVNGGVISFEMAAAMVIGSNMGTTITIIVGSIGGNVTKKRIAWSHFFFNMFTGLMAAIFIRALIALIDQLNDIDADPVTGLALFHTVFNLTGVIVFTAFLNPFVAFITGLVKEQKKQIAKFISLASVAVPEAAAVALENEVKRLARMSMLYHLRIIYSRNELYNELNSDFEKYTDAMLYDEMKALQDLIFSFASAIQYDETGSDLSRQINTLLHSARYATISAKSLKDVKTHIKDVQESENAFCNALFNQQRSEMEMIYKMLYALPLQEASAEIIYELEDMNQSWKNNDRKFTEELLRHLQQSKIGEDEVSMLLSLQRGFTQALRQIIASHRDLLLCKYKDDLPETI
jgi:phosphate:Na+ symporter